MAATNNIVLSQKVITITNIYQNDRKLPFDRAHLVQETHGCWARPRTY